MLPAVSQGWGNQHYLIRGGQIEIEGKSLYINKGGVSTNEPRGQVDRAGTSLIDFNHSMFGGHNSWYAGAYANHKPMAFLGNFRMISAPNYAWDLTRNLYIVGFDGSGIFFNKGDKFEDFPYRAGPGFELFSPSGSALTASHDLALLRHNDHVFMAGAHTVGEVSASNLWTNDFGWTHEFVNEAGLEGNSNETVRTYRMMSMNQETDKRIIGPVAKFEPDADNQNHMHSCDMIAFKNDLYYANWVDVLRFPGASGTPSLVLNTTSAPRARSFETWPSGGVVGGAGAGENRLLMLQSDAELYRVTQSGVNLLVDFESVRTNMTARETDNFARSSSATDEPGRTPLLMKFNNELHAFVTTATSGYTHFTCPTNPSGTTNWTDRTDSMFADLRSADSCVYGFSDEVRDKMFLLQVSYSKFGHFGSCGGGQGCGGGMWLYQYDKNRTWEELWRGNIGMPPRGLIPYQNIGPFAVAPSGNNPQVMKCSDYTVLSYNLFDQLGRNVSVDVEYSVDDGATWTEARRFKSYTGSPLGSGISELPTSPDGVSYEFFWDHVNDIGFSVQQEAVLRVRPRLVK